MRYAAYVRISSELQVGNFSIDAQKRAIKDWVKSQDDGKLVKTYVDEGQSGRTTSRPGFQRMRRDARKRKFDALVVHKFDRFARNRTDALALKSLLRQDYGVKVYSVSEPSEDSDGPMGALIEGILMLAIRRRFLGLVKVVPLTPATMVPFGIAAIVLGAVLAIAGLC